VEHCQQAGVLGPQVGIDLLGDLWGESYDSGYCHRRQYSTEALKGDGKTVEPCLGKLPNLPRLAGDLTAAWEMSPLFETFDAYPQCTTVFMCRASFCYTHPHPYTLTVYLPLLGSWWPWRGLRDD
jgi:hypothetical protein